MQWHDSSLGGKRTRRLAEYARALAEAAGAREVACDLLMRAAQLHDVGKLGVPAELLRKERTLSGAEREQLSVVGGETGKGAADRNDPDTGAQHYALTDPIHQLADARRGHQPQQGERADNPCRRGSRDPEAASEDRDGRRNDAETGRYAKGNRREHANLAWQAL